MEAPSCIRAIRPTTRQQKGHGVPQSGQLALRMTGGWKSWRCCDGWMMAAAGGWRTIRHIERYGYERTGQKASTSPLCGRDVVAQHHGRGQPSQIEARVAVGGPSG